MSSQLALLDGLTFHPVTPDRWDDLEKLFGPRGAYAGCWCMWWRLSRAEFSHRAPAERRAGLKELVDGGQVPGILAYAAGEPVGWCSIGPRESYAGLERSVTLKRVDDQPVWSIVCFFVPRALRGQGLMTRLLEAAVAYAVGQGAQIVEGYPVEAEKGKHLAPVSSYTGLIGVFRAAGFVEVARRSTRQPVMRYFTKPV
jgi:GNAT superfamily N-acetyltransferase